METFGRRVRRLRQERNLKVGQLADRLRISVPYLSQIEGGQATPSEELAGRIAHEFEEDPEELLFLARRVPQQLVEILNKFPNATASFLGAGRTNKRRLRMTRLAAELPGIDRHINDGQLGMAAIPGTFEVVTADKANPLQDTFEVVRPSIVAFASKLVATELGGVPVFPEIIGTGFIVDSRGIVVTNSHVVQALEALPRHPVTGARSDVALVWAPVQAAEAGHTLPVLFVEVKATSKMTSFVTNGPFYGEMLPDIAFVQLNVRDVPPLSLSTEPDVIRMGRRVATAGFPLGTDPLVVYGKVTQITPFLRQGIVSSVYPFPCPYPHGFTMDIMSQQGSSGSPVFLTDRPVAVGMVHAGFPGTNVTIAIPSTLVSQALAQSGEPLDLKAVPTLDSLLQRAERSGDLKWEPFIFRRNTSPK